MAKMKLIKNSMAVFLAASLVLQPVGIQAAEISVDTEEESTETADFSDDAEVESDETEQDTVSVEGQENADSDTEVTVEEENQEQDETEQEEISDFTSEETDAFFAGDEEDYIDRGTCGAYGSDVNWTIDQNQVLRIQGSGEMEVTNHISKHWKNVKTVEIGDGITNIDRMAFDGCRYIEKIVIPESVTSIGYGAFDSCISLKDVVLPEHITSIEDCTFSSCRSLTSIVIPEDVTSLGRSAFNYCDSLKNIIIPESVTSIGEQAFWYCSSLENIILPESITDIGSRAFEECSSLSNIEIPGNVKRIEDYAFSDCDLKEVRIHKGVEYIGNLVFASNENLKNFFYEGTEAELDGIMENKPSAKYHYEALDHVYEDLGEDPSTCLKNGNTNLQKCKFCDVTRYTGEELPLSGHKFEQSSYYFDEETNSFIGECSYGCGTKGKYIQEFESSDLLIGGSIDDTVLWYIDSDYTLYIEGSGDVFLGSEKFYIGKKENNNVADLSAYPVQQIKIGRKIGGYISDVLIDKFENLDSLEIPDREAGVTIEIKQEKSDSEISLKQAFLGEGVTSFDFSGYKNLSKVTIPRSVTKIEARTFWDCSSLKDIIIPDSVTEIGASAFATCFSLESLVIPDSVTKIGEEAFYYCKNLKSINIPDGITSIGTKTFWGCKSLLNIVIPDSVTEYGEQVFYECTSLKRAILSKNAETITTDMFYNCKNLEEVIIPDGIKYISARAFWNTDKCNAQIPNSMIRMNSYPEGNLTLPCRFVYDEAGTFNRIEGYTYYHKGGADDYDEDNCPICIRTGECGDDATYKLTINGKLTISGRGTADYYDSNRELTSVVVENGIYYATVDTSGEKLKTVKIADSVKWINGFEGCSGLKTVTLGKNVEGDLSQGFRGDTSLETVTISDENPNFTVKDGVVYSKDMSTLVLYPQNKQGEVYELPSSVKTIDEEALTYNQNLKKIILPENLEITYQENRNLSFANSKNLETVVFCKNLTFIPSELMRNCPALTELTIPDGVEEIWDNYLNGAFADCKNLRKVTLPASLKRIGYGAFDNCSQLTEVHYLGTEEQWKQMEIGSHNEYLTDAVLHSYECVEEVLPDCENAGKRVYKCNTCDDSFTVVLPAKGHQIVEIPAIAATCETAGMTAGSKCSVCGKIITEPQQGEAALGHDFGEWQVTVEATCETSGKKTRKCSRCEVTETEELPALEHVPSDWETTKDATCEKNGEEVQECTRCGKVLDRKELPALGHVPSEWYIIKDVTCGENGEQVQVCNRCGEVLDRNELPALGHVPSVYIIKDVTCGENGEQVQVCDRCGEVLKKEQIPATGKHKFGGWCTVKAATVLAEGQRERSCSVCGKKDRVSIAKLKKVLTLNVRGTIPVKVKQTFRVSVTMGKGDSVKTWKSSNTKIATVKSGTVQGVKAGKATITVTLKSGISKKFKVKVQKTNVATTSIKVMDAVTKKKVGKSVSLKAKGRLKLVTTVSPMTSKQKVSWSSSNKKVATITSKGVVKAKKRGKTIITVKSGKKTYKIKVNVK